METRPFPRYEALRDLTWDQCFAMNRNQILDSFVRPLSVTQETTYKVAHLLNVMMLQPLNKAGSTAILTTLTEDDKLPRVDSLPPDIVGGLPLGSVHWTAAGAAGLHLYCYTVTDLLGACMSEAAHLWPHEAEQQTRTKRNFYARLIALYSYWCLRLVGENRRPLKVGLACVNDVIILGCCIPDIPEIGQGKELIRQARYQDLKKRGRHENGMQQRLDVTKVEAVLWDYGNCAETWTFALLCTLPEAVLPRAFGIAVNVPVAGQDVTSYNELWERSKQRYAPICVNCEKLMKQIVRWGKPGDKVVENFSVWKWEGPQ